MADDLLSGGVITKNTGFYAPIMDAYPFRCLMDFIGSTVVTFPIHIEQKRIHGSQCDINKTIFHYMTIDTDKLVDFYLNPDFSEGSIVLSVNMRQFRAKIKNAQKRTQTLTLFNYINNAHNFFANIVIPNQKNNGTLIIDTVKMDNPIEYDYVDYVDDEGNHLPPNLVVQVTEVSRLFGHVANSKCTYAQFICYNKGIMINGITDGKLTTIQTLGRCSNPYNVGEQMAKEQNGPIICTYNIPCVNIKPFYKIGNISPQAATLQIFYAKDKPLKIFFPIGTSGYHQVFLVNVNPITMKPEQQK